MSTKRSRSEMRGDSGNKTVRISVHFISKPSPPPFLSLRIVLILVCRLGDSATRVGRLSDDHHDLIDALKEVEGGG